MADVHFFGLPPDTDLADLGEKVRLLMFPEMADLEAIGRLAAIAQARAYLRLNAEMSVADAIEPDADTPTIVEPAHDH